MVGAGRASAICLGIVGLVVLAAGCQTSLPPAYVIRATSDAVFLVAEQGGGASLRLPANPDDPQVPDTGGNSFVAQSAPTGGLLASLARLQGQAPPAPVRFTATAAQPYYLDLDQNVIGTVYVSNTASAAAGVEAGLFRVALRINDAFAGGMDFNLGPGAASKASVWVPIHVSFAPEAAAIRPGDKVTLEVTQLTGLADLRIGTGGNHQSHLRLQSYPFDPLGGITYLERHKLVIQAPDSNESAASFLARAEAAAATPGFGELAPGLYYLPDPPAPAVAGPGLALGAAFLAPLAWTSARSLPKGRAAALLAVALLVSVALAGCAKKDAPPADANADLPPEARPSVDTKVEDVAGTPVGSGELVGTVRDWRNLTLTGAYVAILGTSNFRETDGGGRFEFGNLTAGKYVLRVDALDMRSLEESVEVHPGKRTVVTVKMAPLDPSAPDRIAHIHDEWRGASSIVVADVSFTPPTHETYAGSTQGASGAPQCLPYDDTGVDGRLNDDLCRYAIPIAVNAKVPPGAGAIDFTLTWSGDAPEMGIHAYNPSTRVEPNATYLPRAAGVPTRVTFFPHEADPGHQGFTNWLLSVFIPDADPTTFGQKPLIDVGEITVKAVAHRTIIPFEPGHPDLWGGQDRIKLFESATDTFGSTTGTLPIADTVFIPGKGLFVPAEAARIEGRLTVSTGPGNSNSLMQEFGLAVKPAGVPASRFAEGLRPIELQGSFPEWTFTLPLQSGDHDQPYQTASNVYFYPTSTADYAYRGEVITFTLTANVIKG